MPSNFKLREFIAGCMQRRQAVPGGCTGQRPAHFVPSDKRRSAHHAEVVKPLPWLGEAWHQSPSAGVQHAVPGHAVLPLPLGSAQCKMKGALALSYSHALHGFTGAC